MPVIATPVVRSISLNPTPQEQVEQARSRLELMKRYLEQGGVATPEKIAEFATEATQHYRLLIDRGVAQRGELDAYLRSIGAK
jgi:hypothetical protein